MVSKKQHEAFNKRVYNYLLNIGEEIKSECSGFKFKVNTYCGLLFISCHEAEKSEVFSIYLRFDKYDDALFLLGYNELGCNPKWNIHTYDADTAFYELTRKIGKVTASKEIPY